MNRPPNVELVLREYLADDGDRAPDYVLDVVKDRIGVQPQRRTWPFPGRTTVTQLRLAAALAAAVIIAVVGYNLLPRQSSIGGTPTPSPTTNPTPTQAGPSPTLGSGSLPNGRLVAGHYTIEPIPELPSLTIAADVPAGWQGYPEIPALISPGAENNTGVLIGFTKTDGLFSDACHWDVDGTKSAAHGDVVVGPTVDDLVAALKANTSYTSSAATPIKVGDFNGQEIELQLPAADVIASCDRRPGESAGDFFVFPTGYYAQGADNRWRLFILDVGGTRLITMLSYFEKIAQADVAAGQAIVESFVITP